MRVSIALSTLLLATTAAAALPLAVAADGELCEPARLSGKAAAGAAAQGRVELVQGYGMMHRRGMMGGGMMGGGMMGNAVRHRYVMMGPGIPSRYAGLRNPLSPTRANIEAGRRLYADNCASCHGVRGRGDGEAGRDLKPRPANLAFTVSRPIASDGYLMWAISEGGEKLGTDMPAFKDALSMRQRWQIILYLRHGLR